MPIPTNSFHSFRVKPSACSEARRPTDSGRSRLDRSGDPERVLDANESGVVVRGVDLLGRVVQASHGGTLEGDAVSVVEDAVEDGVSEGGVAADIVPVLDGELGTEDGAVPGVKVVEDFEKIVATLA